MAKPSRGLWDSVPCTFTPGGLEDEAQAGGYTLGPLNLNWQGKASPSPVDSQPLHGAARWRKGVATLGPGEAWSGLVNSAMQVKPPWALWDSSQGVMPHGELEDKAQYRYLPPQTLAQSPHWAPEHDLVGEASTGQPGDLNVP
ncbi:hypothetical protein NDU88_003338 [Pleurodeles waltl]|uniref:Uncharacterized protein n=1 Tax=Pleurodeles waltl TaxID=8319 RepID=A0AAV7W1U7_PLEWA|nr:hypothetical protein NDU88_003338 [Pleurodeles waltl]